MWESITEIGMVWPDSITDSYQASDGHPSFRDHDFTFPGEDLVEVAQLGPHVSN